ncbi:metal-dependent hydrolase [Xylanibacillus composti]|uniref:Inner membrane protein n=1 Tax=Xylanibacillus composti TaxID=1572762 RepID=A0A8J4H2M1_9BACL|nr:metal-dependent hydrolase [Xylanibacillus composti]MDT9723533.1 metal-dependent hydrolase [Xylanibacillus composti]GIQ68431.1 hypothetical protein XYCOK13_12550 [Xylanibacillus composti]
MDTGTHFVVGLGLAGLAQIDPAVTGEAALGAAVLFGTVLGSQAPDADTLTRLRGNALYIRHHRGWSHSLPALLLWTAAISGGLYAIFQPDRFWPLLYWVLLSVALHIFMDLFNTYGTQALRPFSKKWISWNIIPIFDPIIFLSHAVAVLLWTLKLANPVVVFPLLYAFLALYYVWRVLVHRSVQRKIQSMDVKRNSKDRYLVIPTLHPYHWNVVKIEHNGDYQIGEWRSGKLQWIDRVSRSSHPTIELSKKHPDVAALLSFSTHACPEVHTHRWGHEVRWVDVRYRHRKQYPFVAVVLFDHDGNVLDSYVGWMNEEKVGKKLRLDSY